MCEQGWVVFFNVIFYILNATNINELKVAWISQRDGRVMRTWQEAPAKIKPWRVTTRCNVHGKAVSAPWNFVIRWIWTLNICIRFSLSPALVSAICQFSVLSEAGSLLFFVEAGAKKNQTIDDAALLQLSSRGAAFGGSWCWLYTKIKPVGSPHLSSWHRPSFGWWMEVGIRNDEAILGQEPCMS